MKKTGTVIIGEKIFIHTYSDTGMKLERDGELYDDALDLVGLERNYVETDIPISAE